MTPDQLALLISIFTNFKELGGWFVAFVGAWAFKQGQFVLKREYDALEASSQEKYDALAASWKARCDRVEQDLAEAEKTGTFWRDLYLEAIRMTRTAVDVAATRSGG